MRRRREEPQDVTGRWEALEAEVDDDEVREATTRMRRQAPDETILVEEQAPTRPQPAEEPEPPTRRQPAPRPTQRAAAPEPPVTDETLSSQTVINLDQADPVAEADFHMAYGLYDQAAELVQKALDAEPDRRDLKLKLLEVFFVWGNKDAFRKAAQSLRQELGDGPDADWDKVVIMGRQICPDEKLFTAATTGGGSVDVDLEAGDSPLDLAFEEAAEAADVSGDLASALDFNLEASDERPAPPPRPKKAAPKSARDFSDSSLDIGERTAAGLEAALFDPNADDDEVTGTRTTPDLTIDDDSMAVTQESPTIERPGDRGWANTQSVTMQLADSPTVETPTVETPTIESVAPTVETPTIETPARNETPTVERPALGGQGDFTAEIDLDDLGLDVKDMEELPSDLGDLPMAADRETDTREQPTLEAEDELLSATGVTQVLHGGDEEEDEDATMLAPGFGEGTLTGTEVLEGRFDADDESGSTSLVQTLQTDDGLDLNLSDLTQALHGADTVEQPRASSFSHDVFGGGDTPVDLDIGADLGGSDDDPTGTEEASSIDPQTMTEVGTKLDLARAYIDMGDPEGARSILEEVLDEGDTNQRREAQSLIDVLTA
jgi:pilus assembly protein FimV